MWVWIKRSLFLLVGLVLLGVLGVVFLLVTLDPNQWKSQFKAAAAKQGLTLNLQGDISWQWFPSLALRLGDTTLDIAQSTPAGTSTDAKHLLHFAEARAAVAVKPLFQRQIVIEEITLIQPTINLVVDEQGNNNFTLPEKTNAPAQPTSSTESAATQPPPQLNIANITIDDGTLSYSDHSSKTEWLFSALNLHINDFNDQRKPFRFTAATTITQADLPASPTIEIGGKVILDLDASTVDWQDGKLAVTAGKADMALLFAFNANFKDALALNGAAELTPLNPSEWLQALKQDKPIMANANSLTSASLKTQFAITDHQAIFDKLTIHFDESSISGNSKVTFATETPSVKPLLLDLTLNIDQFNLDDYLAPKETAPAAQTAAPTATANAAPEEPLPLELLTALDMNTNITLGQLQASDLQFTQVGVQLQAKAGVWTLSKFSAQGYDGKITAKAKLFAQNNAAVADAEIDFTTLSVLPLLTALADVSDVEGSINGKITAQAQGNTATQLFERSTAALNMDSASLRLNGLNLESYYCQVAAQIGHAENLPATWPEYTDIANTTVRVNWANQTVSIQQLVADAVNLRVSATGGAQWAAQTYSVRFPLKLLQQNTSANGCLLTSNFLQQQAIDVVRCKGSLANLDLAKQCGLDGVTELAKEALRYNAKKKLDPKKKEIREELKEKLNEKLSKDKKDLGTQFLKEFLK